MTDEMNQNDNADQATENALPDESQALPEFNQAEPTEMRLGEFLVNDRKLVLGEVDEQGNVAGQNVAKLYNEAQERNAEFRRQLELNDLKLAQEGAAEVPIGLISDTMVLASITEAGQTSFTPIGMTEEVKQEIIANRIERIESAETMNETGIAGTGVGEERTQGDSDNPANAKPVSDNLPDTQNKHLAKTTVEAQMLPAQGRAQRTPKQSSQGETSNDAPTGEA